jgi:threonine/homoserine/homoserine lactone efflux protein
MLASSGVNFGFWPSIPHVLGVTCGFFFVLVTIGLSLEVLFEHIPLVRRYLQLAVLGFIIYLVWQVSNNSGIIRRQAQKKPQSFWEAACFQMINPKALVVVITVNTTFISPEAAFFPQFAALVILCSLVTTLSVLLWLGFGMVVGRLVSNEYIRKILNFVMAMLLAVLTVPVAINSVAQF